MALLFRRIHASLDRFDATIERNTEAFDRNAEAFESLQVFMRQERILADRRMEGFERSHHRLIEGIDEMRAEIRANTAQLKALTEATFKMLDRFGEGPTTAS